MSSSHSQEHGHRPEATGTYFVQDFRNAEELRRSTIQDQALIASVGGVLPEQPDPSIFHDVLDVRCGAGGWVIEAALHYPSMRLVGIDMNPYMIEHAWAQARKQHIAERVDFQIADALELQQWSPASFDLVNLNLGTSFLRYWEWPALLRGFRHVIKPGGTVRITESDIVVESNSAAALRLAQLIQQAFYQSGHFFAPQPDGVTSRLVGLLQQHGFEQIQTRPYALEYHVGTPEGDLLYENTRSIYRTLLPFLKKWAQVPDDFEALYQQSLHDAQRPDATAMLRGLTAWGRMPEGEGTRETPVKEARATVKPRKAPIAPKKVAAPSREEYASTYVVQDRSMEEEVQRLMVQDRIVTAAMGGPLPEQPDSSTLRYVLDIGCGSGSWVIEAARVYPEMKLVGIDISQRVINHARSQAIVEGVKDRVEFQVMDALRTLQFPGETFDLVNLRFGVSFLRTWDWPKVLQELQRVTRLGGIIRVTDSWIVLQQHSPQRTLPALTLVQQMLMNALFRAGHLFELKPDGLVDHLPGLLQRYGCQNVQTRYHELEVRAGTPLGEGYYQDHVHAVRTIRPFLQKWGVLSPDYDELCVRALDDIKNPDFVAAWKLLTAWGTRVER